MKSLWQRKGLIALVIFFALLSTSGAALAATGNLENPLAVLGITVNGGSEPGRGADRDGSSVTRLPQGESRGSGGEARGGGHEGGDVTWSRTGEVLFNVWLLFAAAGVVMLLSIPYRHVKKLLRQRRQMVVPVVPEQAQSVS